MHNVTAKSVAFAVMQWISRFGVPLYVITDRGPQFESQLFKELSELIGFHRLRTTAYRPETNSKLERRHRTLKTALLTKQKSWLLALPMVLWGLRVAPDEKGLSAFTMLTGKVPSQPSELFKKAPESQQEWNAFIRKFVGTMREMDYTLPKDLHTNQRQTYIPKSLDNAKHVYLRDDRIKKSFSAPFTGPYPILERLPRSVKIKYFDGREDYVSLERIKPAQMPRNVNSYNRINRIEDRKQEITETKDIKQLQKDRNNKKVTFNENNIIHIIPPRPSKIT